MNLFVNGRICLIGEHSDWASEYKKVNKKIIPGKSIVFGISQGIEANVEKNKRIIINNSKETFKISTNLDELYKYSKELNYYSYCTSVAYLIIKKFNVSGLKINIIKEDLPIKKGLASSAAICILVIRAFSKLYNLNIDMTKEMEIAYEAEKLIGIKCGKMDQLCAYGNKLISIDYKNDNINTINIKKDLYFVYADLNSQKNTREILDSLNTIYPKAKNKKELLGHLMLGIINRILVNKTIRCIKSGNIKKVGKFMTISQNYFDKYLSYLCESELKSPKLHELLNDKKLKKLSYGMKGIGSQGDGCIQILVKDEKSQNQISEYLKSKNVIPYHTTISKNPINKVIIALCGKGTRLYPYTKFVTKEFCPVLYNGTLKPQINVLLEYIYDSGIRDITIAIFNKEQKNQYKKYFLKKFNKNEIDFENKLEKIYKCIKFITVRDSIGFGDTVLRFRKISKGEPVILFLGDTLYNFNDNSINLIKENYKKYGKPIVTISPKSNEEVSSCGICYGKIIDSETMKISKIVEKPTINYCRKNLQINKKIYGIYGSYLITSKIFEHLNKLKLNKIDTTEMQLTDALINSLSETDIYGIIMNNNSLDFGNVYEYSKNFSSLGDLNDDR